MNISDSRYKQLLAAEEELQRIRQDNCLAQIRDDLAKALLIELLQTPWAQWSSSNKQILRIVCGPQSTGMQLFIDSLPK